MKHILLRYAVLALVGTGLILLSSEARAEAFKSKAEAQQFFNELSTFNKGNDRIKQPIRRLEKMIRIEFDRFQTASNSSESFSEMREKYQVYDFSDIRADFDRAIAFAKKVGGNSKSPEIRALANQYVANLTSSQNYINDLAIAFQYHDIRAMDGALKGLHQDAEAISRYWNAQAPKFQAKVIAAKGQFSDIKPTKDVACPYEEGTKLHVLHCIMGEPMAQGTGD